MTERDHLLSRSRSARAVLGLLRMSEKAGCGGLTTQTCAAVLRGRWAASTVAHAVVELRRTQAIVWNGGRFRRAKVWRVA